MTREEHLLTILAEECAEVAQRCSKALRFGLDEIQEGQSLTNAERITQELEGLKGTYMLLFEEKKLPRMRIGNVKNKQVRIEKWLNYSEQ